jgi:hypothetical protein
MYRFLLIRLFRGHMCGFLTSWVLRGEVVSLTPNPQPGGPGLRIYDPRRQGDPVIPPSTGCLFWSPFTTCMGYSGTILTPRPPHGEFRYYTKVIFEIVLTNCCIIIWMWGYLRPYVYFEVYGPSLRHSELFWMTKGPYSISENLHSIAL